MSETDEIEYLDFDTMIADAIKQGGSSESPAVGTYQGVVKVAKYKPSKGGKFGVSLLLQVTEPGANVGRSIWSNQYLTPGPHMHIFFKTFEAMGIPMVWWKQFGSLNAESMAAAGAQLTTLVKGAPVKFVVKMGSFNGEPRPEVGWINRGSGEGLDNTPVEAAAPLGAAPVAAAPLTASPERPF